MIPRRIPRFVIYWFAPSRLIHSRMYAEHSRSSIPRASHSTRKRTASRSTSVTSSISSTTRVFSASICVFSSGRSSPCNRPMGLIATQSGSGILSIFSIWTRLSARSGPSRKVPNIGKSTVRKSGFVSNCSAIADGSPKMPIYEWFQVLNWCLLIPSLWIFDSSVWRGIPSFAAAPDGPETRPRH